MSERRRSLNEIYEEIIADWSNPNPHALPFLHAMSGVEGSESTRFSKRTVQYFLSNAGTWHGVVAERIKGELEVWCR